MDLLVIIGALLLLVFVAYRGFSVILFAPIVALGAVLFFNPIAVFPAYTNLFMEKVAFFFKMYFPMFLLGAVFGKVIELSGFSKSIVSAIVKFVGPKHAILAMALVSMILAYGGIIAFVLVFAVYPFAAELFRTLNIPKRLIPGTIWLGGVTFALDALPGSPQITNLIPTTFFHTTAYAAPILGMVGSIFIFALGMLYLEHARKKAALNNEPYDSHQTLRNEPEPYTEAHVPSPWLAITPLVTVGVVNYLLTKNIPSIFGKEFLLDLPGLKAPIAINVMNNLSLWAVEIALIAGIAMVFITAWKQVSSRFTHSSGSAIGGALLAIANTASEFGYGSIISVLPGFLLLAEVLHQISNPLVSEIVSVTALAGITGSSSGGLSIAMAAMSDIYISTANAAGIPLDVMSRLASMASGGMDSLPHNGAVITLLAITGLTHRQAYGPIFAMTIIKTVAVVVVAAFYYCTGLY